MVARDGALHAAAESASLSHFCLPILLPICQVHHAFNGTHVVVTTPEQWDVTRKSNDGTDICGQSGFADHGPRPAARPRAPASPRKASVQSPRKAPRVFAGPVLPAVPAPGETGFRKSRASSISSTLERKLERRLWRTKGFQVKALHSGVRAHVPSRPPLGMSFHLNLSSSSRL